MFHIAQGMSSGTSELLVIIKFDALGLGDLDGYDSFLKSPNLDTIKSVLSELWHSSHWQRQLK